MTDTNSGFSDLLLLFGGTNPLGGVVRSVQQFQRGVDEFLGAIENLNRTLDELNGTASRVNSLLDTVEEPIKAFVPQITRTIKTTDRLVEQVSGPLEKALPAMAQLSEIVSSPAATQTCTTVAAIGAVIGWWVMAPCLLVLGTVAGALGP